jgi:hypothetical protein
VALNTINLSYTISAYHHSRFSIFLLYYGGKFFYVGNPEYPDYTTDLPEYPDYTTNLPEVNDNIITL